MWFHFSLLFFSALEERNKELEQAIESEEQLKLTFHERETYLNNSVNLIDYLVLNITFLEN